MKSLKEGFITVPGGKVWYKVVGKPNRPPLFALHGGPGSPHSYINPVADLANERQVIFYDQLGCGNSVAPDDEKLWTVRRFTDELEAVVKAFDFPRYHILGQSFGSALAAGYALRKPNGLLSLILTDPYLGTPILMKDAKRLIKTLPQEMQESLKNPKEESLEYKKAFKEYCDQFILRLNPIPSDVKQKGQFKNKQQYRYMWGPAEFNTNGTLKDFDLVPVLHKLTLPVLLLGGRYDEATPEALASFQKRIPNAEMKVFEKSAHLPFWTEREQYMQTVSTYLRKFGLN